MFEEPGRRIWISQLTFVEVQSVFASKVRGGFINKTEAGEQRARLMVDMAAGEIEVLIVEGSHFNADRLIGRHGFAHRLRTLDALQLAPKSQELLDQFVVSDKALGQVASLEGLSVIDPESP